MNGVGIAIWNFLAWIETLDFPTWVREGYVLDTFAGFYVLLAFHSFGMAIVVGICFVISARLFGFGQGFPLSEARKLLPLGWFGFAINLISGLILFIGQPRRELVTAVYDLKMIMIIAAVVTMAMLGRALQTIEILPMADGTVVEVVPERARRLALFMTLFWLMAIAAGRMIAFMQGPPL